jgi:hypothetical protein
MAEPLHCDPWTGTVALDGGEQKANTGAMPGSRRLTPVEVLQRLQRRLEKRMETLQRVKLDGFAMVISELEVELDLLRRATRYLEEEPQLTTRR